MDRNELRRLEKAAREKNKKYLMEWASQWEDQIEASLRKEYEKVYQEEIKNSIDNFVIALAYTLVYSEEWNFDPKNLAGFLEDLFITVDLYRTGEYKPQDYKEDLAKHGVIIDSYDYSKVFKDRQSKLDNLLQTYLNKLENLEKLENEYQNKLEQLNSSNSNKNIV